MDLAKPRWLSREHETFQLTPAQILILESICRGNMPVAEVAADIGKSPSTVSTQLARICARTGARHWFDAYLRFRPQRAGPRRLGGRDRRR